MQVGDSFTSERREFRDPETGRRVIQLTLGDCFDYHLYYFIPSMTRDGRTVIFHRHEGDEVQMYRLDIEAGETVRLTDAKTPNALWRPWLQEAGHGVRDLLSAFNTETDELVYLDDNQIRAVHIFSLADRLLYEVPDDRVPCGLTGVSPDGKHFVFVHADREWWEASSHEQPRKYEAEGGRLDVLELETGTVRTLVQLNTWITHSNFYDNTRILFCHLATEEAILMTDLCGGHYVHLRTQDERGKTCHYQATSKGIVYEVGGRLVGLCDPDAMTFTEYEVGPAYVSHIGLDPEARLWFYESGTPDGRTIQYIPELRPGRVNEAIPLMSPMETYWLGQRSHLHPQLTPDRRSILFTGGDARNRTNHIFLLDVEDLADTVRQE